MVIFEVGEIISLMTSSSLKEVEGDDDDDDDEEIWHDYTTDKMHLSSSIIPIKEDYKTFWVAQSEFVEILPISDVKRDSKCIKGTWKLRHLHPLK